MEPTGIGSGSKAISGLVAGSPREGSSPNAGTHDYQIIAKVARRTESFLSCPRSRHVDPLPTKMIKDYMASFPTVGSDQADPTALFTK